MQPLEKSLRNKLEKTIKDARDIAEDAVRAALEQLGVGESTAYPHLTETDRVLRRKLRAHGRQLGNGRNAKGKQALDRLIEEVAYEHWHRMLFARFLAENDLLMYPDTDDPVAVALEECEDLAADEGAANGWELASHYAARMLPQIFRPDSPVFQLVLPPEHQQKLEGLVTELPQQVFTASDSLGWVYQFWQTKKKDEVNASEVKIGARELPAVTQLFTEPYMVSFLLDNSLGAWFAARRLKVADFENANTEDELRSKVAIPGVTLEYLRFVKQEDGTWKPAADSFEGWPNNLAEFKMLDPCCGSGHFLVSAFLMIVPMRIELEGLSIQEAVNMVLRDNLYGLEIDRRCTEIAAFNLALASWRLAGYRPLPTPQIACTGLAIGGTREQWMDILKGQGLNRNLRFFFGQLYDLFSKAPTLGSLINPHRFLGSGLLDEKGMADLHTVLATVLVEESKSIAERYEMGITAQGVAKAAELLAGRYTLIATSVPYLGRGKQDEMLKEHLETYYPLGKSDLATACVLRCLEFCAKGGTNALVTPQNWLFLTSYTKIRQMLLENRSWNLVARLGPGAFETISGHVVNVALLIMSATILRKNHLMTGIDLSGAKKPDEKAAMLQGKTQVEVVTIPQDAQLKNPDTRVTFDMRYSDLPQMNRFVECYQGVRTGDRERFVFLFWEILDFKNIWEPFRATSRSANPTDGISEAIRWEKGQGELDGYARKTRKKLHDIHESGNRAWGKKGVAINQMSNLQASLYGGEKFDGNVNVIFTTDDSLLSALWAFCSSPDYSMEVRRIDQKIAVTNATLVKVPFDLSHWKKIAAKKYSAGLPELESDDPTQWHFHGRPEPSTAPPQVAVARLLGYRWPAEWDEKMRLSQRAKKLVTRCDKLSTFVDKDGIVCIPPVRGEASAADRLLNLLAKAYGVDWNVDILNALLKDVGFGGKTLETWLRNGFFTQHCAMFRHRPFIWQVWDGLNDGFSVLVNYHKFDRKNLETLIYTYLGDWISRQRDDIESDVDGAKERLAAAEILKNRLELILHGETPYDIFVRWKPIEQQPVGWEPDLNDGVRVNIRPFMNVPDVKTKGAGVLRVKPKIKWGKDRGKEPKRPITSYPWFWGWDGTVNFAGGPKFTGERFNDCRYTLDFKRLARQRACE
ncbi:MAG: DNA methyltransferase [Thermodesulfobacteriota bacterium]|nr:DNA methyltransferase [Thermodesulfobacteriota bacterium]